MASRAGRECTVALDVLEVLVESVTGFWDDHRRAQSENNPGWVRDRDAVAAARAAMRQARGGPAVTVPS